MSDTEKKVDAEQMPLQQHKCSTCENILRASAFVKTQRERVAKGNVGHCKRCQADGRRLKAMGLTMKQYNDLLASQKYKCLCCTRSLLGAIMRNVYVDSRGNPQQDDNADCASTSKETLGDTTRVRSAICMSCRDGILKFDSLFAQGSPDSAVIYLLQRSIDARRKASEKISSQDMDKLDEALSKLVVTVDEDAAPSPPESAN